MGGAGKNYGAEVKTAYIAAIVAVSALSIYCVDKGIFVGTEVYVGGAPCCPQDDYLEKHCKYLFITGISEIVADEAYTPVPRAKSDPEAVRAALGKPVSGFCHIFARPTLRNTRTQ